MSNGHTLYFNVKISPYFNTVSKHKQTNKQFVLNSQYIVFVVLRAAQRRGRLVCLLNFQMAQAPFSSARLWLNFEVTF